MSLLGALSTACSRISDAESIRDATDFAVRAAEEILGARFAAVLATDGTTGLRPIGARGADADEVAVLARLAEGPNIPTTPIALGALSGPETAREAAAALGLATVLAVPCDAGLHRHAWLLLGFPADRAPREDALDAARLLGAHLGSALARLALLEQAAREAEARSVLAQVDSALAYSLDLDATLASIARLVVPSLADWCTIELVDARGRARDVIVHHDDPVQAELGRRLKTLGETDEDGLRHAVLATGASSLVEDFYTLPPPRSEELRLLLDAVALRSVMLVPMRLRGRSIGVIALATAESQRRLGAVELALVERVADRAASALENARLYQEARRSSERLELAIDAGRMGNWEFDVRTGSVWWSPALEALHGIPTGTFGGTWAHYIADIHPEDRQRVVETVQASLAHTSHLVEYRIVIPTGEIRWVEGRGNVYRDDAGSPVRLAGVCLDITERKLAEQTAEAERAKASKLESVGVLAGGIAHDFNNLLTGVLGNLSLARVVLKPSDRPHRYVVDAERAALRARDLTRQLLTFAKGGAPIRKRASLAALVRESTIFALSGANVKPVFEIDPGLWPGEVDAGQIGQVVQNIVINAQQAMPEGGTVLVRLANVSLSEAGELPLAPGAYVRMEFIDHGPGIPPDHLGRVFDPFFTTKQHGTGLGLATSYSVVRKHDGHIGVASEPGRGARFVVHLPARPGADSATSPEDQASTLRNFRGRVLVMDDEDLILDAVRNLLELVGFQVVATHDGDEAVAAARAAVNAGAPFDVILLDLTVPGGRGGRAAVGELLAFQPDARIVVSSGYSDDPVMGDCRALGFADMVVKPYTLGELVAALERLVPSNGAGAVVQSAAAAAAPAAPAE